jgi:hypothetical protein
VGAVKLALALMRPQGTIAMEPAESSTDPTLPRGAKFDPVTGKPLPEGSMQAQPTTGKAELAMAQFKARRSARAPEAHRHHDLQEGSATFLCSAS